MNVSALVVNIAFVFLLGLVAIGVATVAETNGASPAVCRIAGLAVFLIPSIAITVLLWSGSGSDGYERFETLCLEANGEVMFDVHDNYVCARQIHIDLESLRD